MGMHFSLVITMSIVLVYIYPLTWYTKFKLMLICVDKS